MKNSSLKLSRFMAGTASRLSFLKSRKQWVKGTIWFLATFALLAWLKNYVGFLHSSTDSLPYRTFLLLKKMDPQKGDYTCLDSPWYGGHIIKKVAGTEGDAITYDKEGNLWIGRIKVGKPKKKAKDGRVLTPLGPGVVPEGRVFLAGNNERSFDSRYEELGLIPKQALHGRVIGLL